MDPQQKSTPKIVAWFYRLMAYMLMVNAIVYWVKAEEFHWVTFLFLCAVSAHGWYVKDRAVSKTL